MGPSQAVGDGVLTATGVMVLLQASIIAGGVGATASAGQFTVEVHRPVT